MKKNLLLFSFFILVFFVKAQDKLLPFSKITICGKGFLQSSEIKRNFQALFPTQNGANHAVNISQKESSEGKRYTVSIHLAEAIEWQSFTIHIPHIFSPKERIFANGFQSWTGCREMSIQEKTHKVMALFPKVLLTSGDYLFTKKEGSPHKIAGWMYGYIRELNNDISLYMSENESNGYTQIIFDIENNEILLRKDLLGVKSVSGTTIDSLLCFYIGKGNEKSVFYDYFSLLHLPKIANNPQSGWTSWYHYYTHISEKICLDNLAAFQKEKVPIDYFQLDDGWQYAVGDWLQVNEKFPSGILGLTEKIHQAGYQSGLWLAPFICEQKSLIFQQHKDWILRDEKGKLVKAGYNPGWSGNFYTLNFYHPEVQSYLRTVFQTVLKDWKVDFVKLDFLYAVAQIPQQGKSRGEVMTEAMRFLREICGDKKVLGCGVPLSATIGTVDFCRIGPDIGLEWEWKLEKKTHFREMVSTKWAARNTIYRHDLHGHFFLNDPDVFNLRGNDNKLTQHQSHTIFLLNQMLGGILFTSDAIGHYNEKQKREYLSQFPVLEKQYIDVVELFPIQKEGVSTPILAKREDVFLFNGEQNEIQTSTSTPFDLSDKAFATDEKCYLISFFMEKNHYLALVNLSSKPQKICFPYNDFVWFDSETERPLLYDKGDGLTLAAYESRIFSSLDDKKTRLLSDNLHLFPGSEIDSFSLKDHQILLHFHPKFRQKQGVIWLQVPDEKAYKYGKKNYFPEEMNGQWWLKIDR